MDVKFFQTDSENLATLPIRAGQLIYLDDINALFWDKSNAVREEMTDVVILEDSTQRLALTNPTAKLYLVQKPSPALWRYQEGEWRSVSSDLVYYGTEPPDSDGVEMWIDPGEEPEYLPVVAARITEIPITLASANWTGDGPYEQVVSVEGLTQGGYMTPADGMTAQQRAATRNANISILSRDTTTGTLTVVADGDKPTVDIPATVVMIS